MWYPFRLGAYVLSWSLLPTLFEKVFDFLEGFRVRWTADCTAPELPLLPEEPPLLDELSTLHALYASDGWDRRGLMISILSLVRHVSDPGKVAIHIVATGATLRDRDSLVECLRRELEGELRELPSVSVLPERPCNLSSGASSAPLYHANCSQRFVRYCLQEYLPTARRVIWIDTDIMFRDDVRKLYNMRMRYPVSAALYTPYISVRADGERVFGDLGWQARHSDHLEVLLDSQPFNAGIMVFDLSKWRSGRITDALFRWLNSTGQGEKLCTNQFVMNVFFRSGFDKIDWRWNVMLPRRVGPRPRCLEEARAIHWAGPLKPWQPTGWWMRGDLAAPYRPKFCVWDH